MEACLCSFGRRSAKYQIYFAVPHSNTFTFFMGKVNVFRFWRKTALFIGRVSLRKVTDLLSLTAAQEARAPTRRESRRGARCPRPGCASLCVSALRPVRHGFAPRLHALSGVVRNDDRPTPHRAPAQGADAPGAGVREAPGPRRAGARGCPGID